MTPVTLRITSRLKARLISFSMRAPHSNVFSVSAEGGSIESDPSDIFWPALNLSEHLAESIKVGQQKREVVYTCRKNSLVKWFSQQNRAFNVTGRGRQ